MACGILVPLPGIELTPPAVEVWSLNHWTAREVPSDSFKSAISDISTAENICPVNVLKYMLNNNN